MKICQIGAMMLFPLVTFAQKKDFTGGLFSLGQRTTVSLFDANGGAGMGLGGQFRVRLSERINTEWFADYLSATDAFSRRDDYHIGWSVMYYPIDPVEKKFVPYILAGHCFDYTNVSAIYDEDYRSERWSSAVQGGLGVHCNLTDRLDLSLTSQYMIHLGKESHLFADTEGSQVYYELHDYDHHGSTLEGHLLFTASFNYQLCDLWSKKATGTWFDVSEAPTKSIEEGGRRGIIQGTATWYPSWMLSRGVRNNYLGGHLAYYLDDNYSFRGDVIAYRGSQTSDQYLKSHVQLTAGFGRHFPIKRLDPYIYLQGGLAAIELQKESRTRMQPVLGSTFGLNYHVAPWFYFFGEVAYNHVQDPSGSMLPDNTYTSSDVSNLDQLFIGGGLGFQLGLIHGKKGN